MRGVGGVLIYSETTSPTPAISRQKPQSPSVTVSAVQGVGWGAIPARYPPPGKFLHNSPVSPSFQARFTKWRMKRDDRTSPNSGS
jgi:hypothetical protein